jgi:hypothetical protein
MVGDLKSMARGTTEDRTLPPSIHFFTAPGRLCDAARHPGKGA